MSIVKDKAYFCPARTEAQDLRFTIFWKEKKKQLPFHLPQAINAVLRQLDMFKVICLLLCKSKPREDLWENLSRNFIDLLYA